MQKVDIAIAALGAVALIATGLGIGLYDDGNTDFAVTTSDTQVFSNPSENVPSGGLTWEFDVPDNTFHAGGTITIDWSDSQNPTLTGPVDVTVTVTGPDGTVEEMPGGNFEYADNSGTIDLELSAWLDVPEDFSGTQAEADELSHTWNAPLHIEIVIQGPQGQVPGPVTQVPDDPVYTASVEGYWHTYAVNPATPDLENI